MSRDLGLGLALAVHSDQWDAYQARRPTDYQCDCCDAPPGQSCPAECYRVHRYAYRRTARDVAAARHLAAVEVLSELTERYIRGASWLSARLGESGR